MARSGRVRRSVIGWPLRLLLAAVIVVANLFGAAVVLALAAWVLPTGTIADPGRVRLLNLALFGGYLLVALPLGLFWGGRRFRLRAGDAQRRERTLVLYGPLRLATVQTALWLAAAVVFVAFNATFSWRLALSVGETVLLGGLTTVALAYLLSERILRPAAARVLATDPPRRRKRFGVLVRAVLFWALGTGVPVLGLLLSAVSALVFKDVAVTQLAVIVLAIGGTALVVGLLMTVGAARAVADPVLAVRKAMGRVEEGDLHVRVPVYDGTELGQLQAGFNTMAAGLRERERIRDLFGRQVGREVAAAALRSEGQLGGEVRRVAVLFVDLVGSTALAAQRPPTEVVTLLNRFFGVVVEVVESCGGWINKFEGDAALAVFGAPADADDPAGAALEAGRLLARRLAAELPDVTVGIGVSAGEAVAGNIGDVRRYEYTVIGDPVNEAARLTELAKSVPGGVLAAGVAVELARAEEAARWMLGDAVTLRGRCEPTQLATPRPTDAPAGPGRVAEAGSGREDHGRSVQGGGTSVKRTG
ncbi:adenylate/guanylate cyclase domain-containing protein [Pseudonocardia bannensis]|uniref:HAMP domain-containing protein n=1 Tax=Pseudonocardia bannensis TaxID=630973 RepID=A0A848DRV0_9PSEU|nr:adenylate/guanylate cyclase domain-containing protein [Pseudonocardia bannensis]NMH95219.1 HAMP domain-containing protein [Pseudonocardia bannensis]